MYAIPEGGDGHESLIRTEDALGEGLPTGSGRLLESEFDVIEFKCDYAPRDGGGWIEGKWAAPDFPRAVRVSLRLSGTQEEITRRAVFPIHVN